MGILGARHRIRQRYLHDMTDNNQFSQDRKTVTGVLITNLGTPDAPTTAALRRYLAEFLWDPRIVDIPRPLWWLILHGFIFCRACVSLFFIPNHLHNLRSGNDKKCNLTDINYSDYIQLLRLQDFLHLPRLYRLDKLIYKMHS